MAIYSDCCPKMRHQTSTSRSGCHQHSCRCDRECMATNSTVAQTMHHQTTRSRLAVTNTPVAERENLWQKTRLLPKRCIINSKVMASFYQHFFQCERGGHMAKNTTVAQTMHHQTARSRTGFHQHSCHCDGEYMATNSAVAQTMHHQTARSRTGFHQHSCHCDGEYMATNSAVAQTMHHQTTRSKTSCHQHSCS